MRQQWIDYMMRSLNYPEFLFVVEKKLSELPHLQGTKPPDRRLDMLIYRNKEGGGLAPLLLIECKAHPLEKSQMDQLIGYNHYVGACFVALVNKDEVQFGYQKGDEYVFHSFLPTHDELILHASK